MPLRDGCSDEDIAANIATLIDEGKTREQAAAIAYEHCGKAAPQKQVIFRHHTGGIIKAVNGNTFEGYLVRHAKITDRDLENEWFSAKTYLMLEAGYPVKGAPVNYQHGMEHKFGNTGIGIFDFVDRDDIGLFVSAQLHAQAQYEEMLRELGRTKGIKLADTTIRQKAELAHKAVTDLVHSVSLRQSMGADPATWLADPDTGHIEQCGIIHGALTPTPADDKNPLVRFKSALDSVYDLQESRASIAFPVGLENGTTVKGLDYEWVLSGGATVSTGTTSSGVTINVYPPDPVKAVTPTQEAKPESADKGTSETPVPRPSKSVRDNKDTKPMPAKAKQQAETRLKALSPDEAEMLRNELMATLDTLLGSLSMEADEAMRGEMVDEMEDHLNKQDEMEEGVVEAAAEAVAEDLGQVVEADAPLTAEVVEQVVADNLEEILPEAVKGLLAQHAKANARRKSNVDRALGNVKTLTPAQSRKSQVGGMTHKAFTIVGKADTPSLGKLVKSIASGKAKAMNPYIGALGGHLVGQDIAPGILDPLREKVVMFDMGVKQTTVSNVGTYVVRKMTTAPTAYRPGINQAITASDPKYDTITAFLRPIASEVIIPMQLYRAADAEFEKQVQDQAIESIKLQIDKEILIGEGSVTGSNTGAEIKGILSVLEENSTLASTNVVALTTNGRAPTFDDLVNAETQIAANNVELTDNKSGWVMHSRTRGTFRRLTTTTGEPLLFREGWSGRPQEELIGYKVGVTNQVPINITTGTSTDTSYIFLGEYGYVEYVMYNDFEVIVDEVTLADKLQVRIIIFTWSDVIVHYPEAFYCMTGVRQ